jgi:hypothetical protein
VPYSMRETFGGLGAKNAEGNRSPKRSNGALGRLALRDEVNAKVHSGIADWLLNALVSARSRIEPKWRNGKRRGFKILRPYGLVGSTPTFGTKLDIWGFESPSALFAPNPTASSNVKSHRRT